MLVTTPTAQRVPAAPSMATPSYRATTAGLDRLDSWSTDGHKLLNVAYDCGILFDRCVAAHCVWLSDTEIALMRDGQGGR